MMKDFAKKIRKDAILLTSKNKAGHIGSMLSMAEILTALFEVMNLDPLSHKRDRLILSKGHAGGILAAALYEKDVIDKKTFDSYYISSGHGPINNSGPRFLPGIDYISCSLGHGIGVGVGMALAGKINKQDYKVYVIVGNGECNEGSVWEAMMTASHFKLDNLVVIVDHNNMQAMGSSERCMDMGCLEQKFETFGARVISVDGHEISQIKDALKIATKDQPLVVVAHTIKGKGVSFMENNHVYHYGYVEGDLLKRALQEVEQS